MHANICAVLTQLSLTIECITMSTSFSLTYFKVEKDYLKVKNA